MLIIGLTAQGIPLILIIWTLASMLYRKFKAAKEQIEADLMEIMEEAEANFEFF
jgi:hypothetical protein